MNRAQFVITAGRILQDLEGRGGFDAWWDTIDPDVQDEILVAIADIIANRHD